MNPGFRAFPSFRILLIALNLVAMVATSAIVGFAVFLQRESSVDYAQRTVATLASALKQHSTLLLRTTDQGLAAIADRLDSGVDFKELTATFLSLDSILGVELLQADGTFITGVGNLGTDTLHRQAEIGKADRDAGWRVGLPLRAVNDGGGSNWALPVRHRMPDGRWVIALVSLDEFDTFYGSLDLQANGAVGLIRRDGRLLARVPSTELGRDISGSELVGKIKTGTPRASVRSVSSIDGIARLSSFDSLDEFPVVAYVAIDNNVVARFWGPSALSLIGAGAGLLLVIASLSIGVDYSYRRRRMVEGQLQESRNVVQAVLDAAGDGLLAIDPQGEVLAANPATGRMLGHRAPELVGRNALALLPPECQPLLSAATGEGRVDTTLPAGDDKPLPVSVTVNRAEGDLRVITIHDRREELEHTAKVAVLERMRMIGQLTGGVAHDFNNILTIISLNLEMLGTLIAESPLWEQYAVPALRAAKRGSALTGHLLAFARRQPLAPEIIDPNAALRDTKTLLGRSLGERWGIDACENAQAWPLLADAAQLETALVNLAINARDAMPDGGRIVLETRNITIDADYAKTVGELQPGDYVMIAVTDEGTGMSEEVLARAFEPFFTTKPVGKGSGLGLSMVFGFTRQSNGNVTIYSEVGRGTTVKLYLPRALPKSAGDTAQLADTGELPCLRVFVVEDDDDVRATAVRALRAEGMVTIEANSGEDALELVRRGVDFDLLFTDVVLPKMTGRQLADALRADRPDLKVLYSSGYTENAIVHHGRLDPGVVLLSKPYTQAALREGLAQVLHRAAVAS